MANLEILSDVAKCSGAFRSRFFVNYKSGSDGTKTDLFWKEDETHFIFANRADEIIDFLNRNIKM